MAIFSGKTDEQRAAEATAKQAAQVRRAAQEAEAGRVMAEKAWWASFAGQATSAFNSGDAFFQVEIPHSTLSGHANAAWGTAQRTLKHGPATDTLGEIEAAGWRLDQSSWVYVQTGENSRDKFLASGQQTVVNGYVTGIYLFRRAPDAAIVSA